MGGTSDSGTGADPETLAAELYEARRDRAPVVPLTQRLPAMDVEQAYRVQREFIRLMLADGDEIIGYKLGLTSKPMQQLLGVSEPDFSAVMASHRIANGGGVARDQFIEPRIEAEIVFRLGAPLRGPNVTTEDVLGATAGMCAGLEIIDSRIEDWRIELPDTVADLASCGAVVVSDHEVPSHVADARLIEMTLARNGEIVERGAGAATMGDPLNAVAWLANTLATRGVGLEAGHLILTGALHRAVEIQPGDTFHARFDRLGTVEVGVG